MLIYYKNIMPRRSFEGGGGIIHWVKKINKAALIFSIKRDDEQPIDQFSL